MNLNDAVSPVVDSR